MTPDDWMILGAALLFLVLVWTVWTLVRLRRLEDRVGRAWTALDTQLQRRVGLAEELVRDHPAALGEDLVARLSASAGAARRPADGDRELAENDLGRVLRDLPDDLPGVPTALLTDLAGTTTRLALARRFYNDAVRDTRALRRSRFGRLLRLHASRPLPRYFDIEVAVPSAPAAADRVGEPRS